mgnify:CR=1 FL=1|tara:strand:+ start:2035 stop:2283 length:249 start_codon:yes stop_codon:yes gene_type:complete
MEFKNRVEHILAKYGINIDELENTIDKYFYQLEKKRFANRKYRATAHGKLKQKELSDRYYYLKSGNYHIKHNPNGNKIKKNE